MSHRTDHVAPTPEPQTWKVADDRHEVLIARSSEAWWVSSPGLLFGVRAGSFEDATAAALKMLDDMMEWSEALAAARAIEDSYRFQEHAVT